MTEWKRRTKAGMLIACISAALYVFFVKIGAGTILHDPAFVFLQEAQRSESSMFTGIRLRWAALRGARADQPSAIVGSRTPLQVAAERENLEFLRRTARYSSREHLRSVFRGACERGQEQVLKTLRAIDRELHCGAIAQ